MGKKLRVRYDKDGDILEVWWETRPGYYSATENESVEAHLDSEGNVQGFQIFGVSKLDSGIDMDLLSANVHESAKTVGDD